MKEHVIQVLWDGPFTRSEMIKFSGPTDKGLYQVYTYHPVYGFCLVYIGETIVSFASRPLSHRYESGSDSDRNNVRYYVGRLIDAEGVTEEQWKNDIAKAEMLLIHAHGPAYNSKNIGSVGRPTEVANVRVLNWGNCRSLQREVSGLMWSAPIDPGLRPHRSEAKRPAAANLN